MEILSNKRFDERERFKVALYKDQYFTHCSNLKEGICDNYRSIIYFLRILRMLMRGPGIWLIPIFRYKVYICIYVYVLHISNCRSSTDFGLATIELLLIRFMKVK